MVRRVASSRAFICLAVGEEKTSPGDPCEGMTSHGEKNHGDPHGKDMFYGDYMGIMWGLYGIIWDYIGIIWGF